ncbi:glycosyltransferase family 2 protein [Candidatus Woesebacteria bacterium]|nr:glycosyltransferase family 2 protein [Candidatus Woesebacteria bacterium]
MKKVTICIPTYYGSESLIDSLSSIRNSKMGSQFRIIVALDGKPLEKSIEKRVLNLNVELIENTDNKGQMARIIQMIDMVDTPYVILTQDDIMFESDTIVNLLKHFQNNKKLSMVGALELPTTPKLLIEKVVAVGIFSARYIGKNWRKSNNYLMASGRCMAFNTQFLKSLELPEKIVNSDSYLYLATKKAGGIFESAQEAIVRNPAPQTVQEHLKQAYRFSISQRENSDFIDSEIADEFAIPFSLKIKAVLRSFILYPIYTPLYIALTVYSKLFNMKQTYVTTGVWNTDVSTKRKKSNN